MRSRKELKKSGLRSLKKHYLLFILLCVIASFIGSEFNNSLSFAKMEKNSLKVDSSIINTDSNVKKRINDVSQNISNNKVVKKIKDTNTNISDKINDIKKNKKENYKKHFGKIFDNKRGVFASIVNLADSGSLFLTIFFAIKSMIGVANISVIISIIASFIIYMVYWGFFVNIFKVVSRRIFLEGRIYKKIAAKDSLFLIRVKKWSNTARVMFRTFIYKFLWDFTIVGGFIKKYSYFLVPYIVAENPSIKGKDAIKLSRDMMYGHKFECFVMDLSFIGWDILGFFTFGLSNVFFSNAYEVAAFSEYYSDLRSIAKKNNIANVDLLCDTYLYEKADEKKLFDVYYKDLQNIEVKSYKPKNIKERIEDLFGINLSSAEKEKEYEKNRVNELLLRNIEAEAKGVSYPARLYFIPEKQKRKRFEIVNYLRRYDITTLILIFFSFSFVGWFWEVLLHLLSEGRFVNRGVMYGPWLPIYGTGGVLVLLALNKFRDKPLLQFVNITILCGIVEYFTSFFLEITHNGTRWWDYSGYFINLNGRICAEGLIVFGLGGTAAVYFIAPALDNMIKKINKNVILTISIILVSMFIVDKIYSSKNPNVGDGITSYQIVTNIVKKIRM